MRFTDIFIKRPVLAISLSFLIALLGFQAIFKMQVREYPEVINTVITVAGLTYDATLGPIGPHGLCGTAEPT